MTLIADQVLSPSQAGRRLGVSAHRVLQLVNEGRLPAQMTPLGRLIPADAVDALAAERLAKAG